MLWRLTRSFPKWLLTILYLICWMQEFVYPVRLSSSLTQQIYEVYVDWSLWLAVVCDTQQFSIVMKAVGSHSTSDILLALSANLIKGITSLYKLFLSYLNSRIAKPTYINMCLLWSCVLQHKKTYKANGHAMICFVSKWKLVLVLSVWWKAWTLRTLQTFQNYN